MYTFFRRFYKPGDSIIITETIGMFTDLDTAHKFLDQETEDKTGLYFHLDTYFVENQTDQVYKNIAEIQIIAKKIFHQI